MSRCVDDDDVVVGAGVLRERLERSVSCTPGADGAPS